MRDYNFTTAVIGESEAAVSALKPLHHPDTKCFMFGMQDKPLTKILDHPNIHCFQGSRITAIGGTLGDFQITVETR
jgi:heterodisulfide reductase subunit A-like polyferredoxin